MATNVEERLRELEAEVIAARAKNPPATVPKPALVVPNAPAKSAIVPAAPTGGKVGLLKSWKTKVLVVGGIVLAGVLALWVVGKLVKIALYVGLAAAVVGVIWWLTRKKKPTTSA